MWLLKCIRPAELHAMLLEAQLLLDESRRWQHACHSTVAGMACSLPAAATAG
jgi:hypothetical protein